ncbi:MAG: family 10 glycosylhydrolase, partial [Planctomycetaceae bacterium]
MTSLLIKLLLTHCLLMSQDPRASEPPPTPREFRAAWVATLDNIDWPSKRGLSAAEQHNEIRRVLDAAVDLRLNAIILQVRAAADAIYPSQLEPWSISLSGTQDKQPDSAWD